MLTSPLVFSPENVPRVWGGKSIAERFGRPSLASYVGESWELHGGLTVEAPEGRGTLDELVDRYGERLLGSHCAGLKAFPLLTKWLDCQSWLSVQVHPDDRLAREFTGDPQSRGKTEAWFVCDSRDGAEVFHDFQAGLDPLELQHLEGEAILPFLRKLAVLPGSLLYTPAGTVHALGPGLLIYEVQQQSDLTYRLYDWGRERPIHPKQAWRCILEANVQPGRGRVVHGRACQEQLSCPYFQIRVIRAPETVQVQEQTFVVVVSTGFSGYLKGGFGRFDIAPGQTILLPANLGQVDLCSEEVEAQFLLIDIPGVQS